MEYMDHATPLKGKGKGAKFTFGKYKDRSIKEILDEDPSYIVWANANVAGFIVSTKILKEATEAVDDLKAARNEDIWDDLFGEDWYDGWND